MGIRGETEKFEGSHRHAALDRLEHKQSHNESGMYVEATRAVYADLPQDDSCLRRRHIHREVDVVGVAVVPPHKLASGEHVRKVLQKSKWAAELQRLGLHKLLLEQLLPICWKPFAYCAQTS